MRSRDLHSTERRVSHRGWGTCRTL